MAAPVNTRKQRKVSKNKKKNWRKHVNIDDVEEYLEDKRLQERTGGLVAEKSDEALFYIEKSAKNDDVDRTRPDSTKAKKRRAARDKPLKCFSKLQADSAVRIPKVSRSDLPRSLKKTDRRIEKRITRLASYGEKRNQLKKKVKVPSNYDVWSEDAENTVFRKKFSIQGSIDKNTDKHFLLQTKKQDVKIPNTGTVLKKPSAVASVEVPHPGASYNPSFDHHQALLLEAHHVEVKKEKAAQKITNALDVHFPNTTRAEIEASHLEEMSVGIFTEEDENSDNEVVSSGISYNPPVRREDKKTIVQRNKEKRLKEKQQKLQDAKLSKLRRQELLHLKQIKSEIRKGEEKKSQRQAVKAKKKEQSVMDTKKLGKVKFESPDMELKLSEELEGSLRELKPEGNLLSDRFKSFQKRNLIETRERAKHKRKYKEKVFEKKSHREVTLDKSA